LSWSIASHFSALLKCVFAAQNGKKFIKNPLFLGSRSFQSSILLALKSSSPVLVMISSMSVPICNRLYATQANTGKIKTF